MKKLIFSLLLAIAPFSMFGQPSSNDAKFDTNGPMGEVLFPENEVGDVVISEIIEAKFSSDTLKGLALEFLNMMDQSNEISISKITEGVTKTSCRVSIEVGRRLWENPAPFAPPIEKAKSVVDFNAILEFRDGKYRFTLSGFNTDRWRIRGDGEDQGPSNRIHWQRVNSITKDFRKKSTREQMISEENEAYLEEYNAVMSFVEKLKTFAVISDDF